MRPLLFFLFFFTGSAAAAQNVSGFYSGTLYNDTTRHTQVYELALSDYRNKVSGYAYATFIANDTFYYSIRRIRGEKKGGHLVVEDAEMIAHNFPNGPDKGVRRITQIPIDHLTNGDTLGHFKATWKTTATKQFYSLPGTMAMQRRTDSSQSALFAHLTEMRLLPTPTTEAIAAAKPAVKKADQKEKETSATPTPVVPMAYTQRAQKRLQTIEVESDSLVLYFYDNGVVDGDVISVYLNGENIIANAKLLGVATKKTVHLSTVDAANVELVLVAETLGDMPPNTGLLVVQDGARRYEVRFSADLQTNATLVFKKK